jgi:hypothetical protein
MKRVPRTLKTQAFRLGDLLALPASHSDSKRAMRRGVDRLISRAANEIFSGDGVFRLTYPT